MQNNSRLCTGNVRQTEFVFENKIPMHNKKKIFLTESTTNKMKQV